MDDGSRRLALRIEGLVVELDSAALLSVVLEVPPSKGKVLVRGRADGVADGRAHLLGRLRDALEGANGPGGNEFGRATSRDLSRLYVRADDCEALDLGSERKQAAGVLEEHSGVGCSSTKELKWRRDETSEQAEDGKVAARR